MKREKELNKFLELNEFLAITNNIIYQLEKIPVGNYSIITQSVYFETLGSLDTLYNQLIEETKIKVEDK